MWVDQRPKRQHIFKFKPNRIPHLPILFLYLSFPLSHALHLFLYPFSNLQTSKPRKASSSPEKMKVGRLEVAAIVFSGDPRLNLNSKPYPTLPKITFWTRIFTQNCKNKTKEGWYVRGREATWKYGKQFLPICYCLPLLSFFSNCLVLLFLFWMYYSGPLYIEVGFAEKLVLVLLRPCFSVGNWYLSRN